MYFILKKILTKQFKERIYNLIHYVKYNLFSIKSTKFKIREFSCDDSHVFFGYYDISPFDSAANKLLAMKKPLLETKQENATLSVGIFDLNDQDPVFKKIGDSTSWCWQQGCRLQWYPSGNDSQVIYNKVMDGGYGAVVQEIDSQEIKDKYSIPIYAISKDGEYGLSLNFSRLQRLRPGYGYNNICDKTINIAKPKDDGIWLVNMKTKVTELLFSIDDIASIKPLGSMDNAKHYFNHILFNPCGKRFMFIHLWMNKHNRYGRLITSDIDGSNICVLNEDGYTSHYVWKTDKEILSYSTHKDEGTQFYLYHDQTEEREVIGKDILVEDGHPSFSNDHSTILLDTYPNRIREQQLFLYNLNAKNITKLGTFFSPVNYTGEVRCDLHPRWSDCNRYVCIDSAHNGTRAMYVIDTEITES